MVLTHACSEDCKQSDLTETSGFYVDSLLELLRPTAHVKTLTLKVVAANIVTYCDLPKFCWS